MEINTGVEDKRGGTRTNAGSEIESVKKTKVRLTLRIQQPGKQSGREKKRKQVGNWKKTGRKLERLPLNVTEVQRLGEELRGGSKDSWQTD